MRDCTPLLRPQPIARVARRAIRRRLGGLRPAREWDLQANPDGMGAGPGRQWNCRLRIWLLRTPSRLVGGRYQSTSATRGLVCFKCARPAPQVDVVRCSLVSEVGTDTFRHGPQFAFAHSMGSSPDGSATTCKGFGALGRSVTSRLCRPRKWGVALALISSGVSGILCKSVGSQHGRSFICNIVVGSGGRLFGWVRRCD